MAAVLGAQTMAPFKKNLTPLSRRGRVEKHAGKGGVEQRLRAGDRESVTGEDALSRMVNSYPAVRRPAPPPTSAPALGGPALGSPTPSPLGMGAGEEPVR